PDSITPDDCLSTVSSACHLFIHIPNPRRREFHQMIVRITEVNTPATFAEFHLAADRNIEFHQPVTPMLYFVLFDCEGKMKRALAIMGWNLAVRENVRLPAAAFQEQEQNLVVGNAKGMNSVPLADDCGKSENPLIEIERTVQVRDIQR